MGSRTCYVCKNRVFYVTYHRIPANEKRRKLWCKRLKLNIKDIPKYCYVCSNHFEKNQFVAIANRICLIPSAVPSEISNSPKNKKKIRRSNRIAHSPSGQDRRRAHSISPSSFEGFVSPVACSNSERLGGETRGSSDILSTSRNDRNRRIRVDVTSSSGGSDLGSFTNYKPLKDISRTVTDNIWPLIKNGVLQAVGRPIDDQSFYEVASATKPQNEEQLNGSRVADLEQVSSIKSFYEEASATKPQNEGQLNGSRVADLEQVSSIKRKTTIESFSDIHIEDLSDPEQRRICWDIIKNTMKQKTKCVSDLQKSIRRLTERIHKLRREKELNKQRPN